MNAHLLSNLPVLPPARIEVLNRPWKLNCIAVQTTVILLGSFTAYQRLQVLRKLYFSEYLVYARMNRLFPSFIIAMTAVVKCKKAIQDFSEMIDQMQFFSDEKNIFFFFLSRFLKDIQDLSFGAVLTTEKVQLGSVILFA